MILLILVYHSIMLLYFSLGGVQYYAWFLAIKAFSSIMSICVQEFTSNFGFFYKNPKKQTN